MGRTFRIKLRFRRFGRRHPWLVFTLRSFMIFLIVFGAAYGFIAGSKTENSGYDPHAFAIGQHFVMKRDLANLLAHQAQPDAQGRERDARQRKQEAGADSKGIGVITGIFRSASGDKSIRAAEHDREDHEGAKREGQPGMPAAETAKAKFDPESPSHRQ